jgi:hypothetical protein
MGYWSLIILQRFGLKFGLARFRIGLVVTFGPMMMMMGRCCSSSFCCCFCFCIFLLPPDCHFFFSFLFWFSCAVAVAVVFDIVQHHKSRARFDCQPAQLSTPFRHPILFITNLPTSMRQLLLSHIAAKYASEWNSCGLNPSIV